MFRIRKLILVCVAATGSVLIFGCPRRCTSDAECGDGKFCNGIEKCDAGLCKPGEAPCLSGQECDEEKDTCNTDVASVSCNPGETCNDGNPCTNDSCSDGSCQHVNNENACNDGNTCTTNDQCSNGSCSGTPMNCDDKNRCTDDKCVNGECQHPLIQCPQGFACRYDKGCYRLIDAGVPLPGSSGGCNPTNPCPVLAIAKWTKREITYQLEGGRDAGETALVGALYEEAANAWSDVIPLDIRLARAGETVDIRVQLCEEGDTEPACDTLTDDDGTRFAGEATFPNRDKPARQLIAVPESLDDQIVRNGVLAVILHELGHNLGLLHSEDVDAIMYPVIVLNDVATEVELHADDITRIQDLYGDRGGILDPIEPSLPVIPSNPDCVLPDPNGPDRDQDGLADTFEELVSRTDPDDSDTDGDGLLDGCEIEFGLDPNNPDGDADGRPDRVEVIEGTPARAPVICHAAGDSVGGERVVFLDAAYFDELGLEEAGVVQITNLRNGCSTEDVTIRRGADPDCTVRMARGVREELCIFQLGVAVPLRICARTAPVILEDFDPEKSVIFTDGRGTSLDYIRRGESRVLQTSWSLDGFEDYKFVVARVSQSQDVGPGQSLVADIWVDRPQVIEVGAKISLPHGSKREDFKAIALMPQSWKPEVWVPITHTYELTEVDFVIDGKNNCDPVGGACDPSAGTFWIDNLRLERTPQVLYDFEDGIDPPPTKGGSASTPEHPEASANHVLQFDWKFASTTVGSDPFVVLVFDGISVGPCDRLIAEVEVSVPTTVRLEAKTPGPPPVVMDTRSRMMLPGVVEDIEIVISTRYALGEIAVVIERDLNEEQAGIVWLDNIRLIRGE